MGGDCLNTGCHPVVNERIHTPSVFCWQILRDIKILDFAGNLNGE